MISLSPPSPISHYLASLNRRTLMVWIDGSPVLQAKLASQEAPIKIIQVPHTPLFICITLCELLVYHGQTFIPIASHKRPPESIGLHGHNVDIKIQQISLNTARLQQSRHTNIFISTSLNYIIFYQIQVQLSKPLFEVVSSQSDELLQSGYPMCITKSLFSMSNLIKSATKSIIVGSETITNLENIEHFGDLLNEDEANSLTIPQVKLVVLKTFKVSIGIENFWLQPNSHHLYIYSTELLQTLNLKTMEVSTIDLHKLDWFDEVKRLEVTTDNTKVGNSQLKLFYNEYFHYFLLKSDFETWKLELEDGSITGAKVYDSEANGGGECTIHFNPVCDLILEAYSDHLSLFKFSDDGLLYLVKYISNKDHNFSSISFIQWSPDGEYFALIDGDVWQLYSKFGNCHFNSMEVLKEAMTHSILLLNFLRASHLFISSNCKNIVVMQSNQLYLFNILLLANSKSTTLDCELSNLICFNSEYLSYIDQYLHVLHKFPILPHFKKIIRKYDQSNLQSQGHITLNGNLTITSSKKYQFCMTQGDNISVSTPYMTGGKVNHIVWFNFKNFFLESLNIVNHLWTENDHLIVFNQQFNESTESFKLVDEIIVLDVSDTKYGNGGNGFQFTSDKIIWRYKLGSKMVAKDYRETGELVILTDDLNLSVIKFKYDKVLTVALSTKIDLKMLSSTLKVLNISQIKLVNDKHFFILLNTGEFYFLKRQDDSSGDGSKTLFNLMLINHHIEFIGLTEIEEEVLYVFDGSAVLIYSVEQLVKVDDSPMQPIIVRNDLEYFQPLLLNVSFNSKSNKSINLLGLENFNSLRGNKFLQLKTRVNHKHILNDFIEYYIVNKDDAKIELLQKRFENFNYSLELLLFKYLTNFDIKTDAALADQLLEYIMKLINNTTLPETIYINCLRKIEVDYWPKFFETLKTTPLEFMNKLIDNGNEELCHNYLIIYLNFKKEHESSLSNSLLQKNDEDIILKILKMLAGANRWNWCYELCRFIKFLDPSGKLLKVIEKELVSVKQ